jgi:histidyl-tRNA synthetase
MKKIQNKKITSILLDSKNLDKQAEASIYYGFNYIETPEIKIEDKNNIKSLKESNLISKITLNNDFEISAEERSAILRTYFETDMCILPQPVMLIYNSLEGKGNKNNKIKKFCLEIIGSEKSIAEAIIIKTALSILQDNGFKNLCIDINTIGDKESSNRFTRELTSYFRKNINDMRSHCRQSFKKDPMLVLKCLDEKCLPLKENAPKTIDCLSDESRTHFKEVLEYLESLNIDFKINDYLISDKRYSNNTVFEIKQKSENPKINNKSLAFGFRSDNLSKKFGYKKDIPIIGAKLCFQSQDNKKQKSKNKKTPIFFIQLGEEAKHLSLKVIDNLRKENICVNHSLGRDKLTGQLALAEKLKASYILMMGKKEAIDETIMVRNTDTRSQETVRLTDLAKHLKGLLKNTKINIK